MRAQKKIQKPLCTHIPKPEEIYTDDKTRGNTLIMEVRLLTSHFWTDVYSRVGSTPLYFTVV